MEDNDNFCNAGYDGVFTNPTDVLIPEEDRVAVLFNDCVDSLTEQVLVAMTEQGMEGDTYAPPEIVAGCIFICTECGLMSSIQWWKCCMSHSTERGPDVICQSCVEKLHPYEPEFWRK